MKANRIAFVCPRYPAGSTLGGAETLLKQNAAKAAAAGRHVVFLTTCAQDHFTWQDARPPGVEHHDGVEVRFFQVDADRDIESFLRIQDSICRGRRTSYEDELAWLKNSVNSSALTRYLEANAGEFDRIVAGPYLFGLTYFASMIAPRKTLLVPCLHDEPFAYVRPIAEMFRNVRGCMFNTAPERDLACGLYGLDDPEAPNARVLSVVGMGLDACETDPESFRARHGIENPYVIYSGRREPLKGTPILIDYMNAFRLRTGRDVKLFLTGSGQVGIPPSLQPHVMDLGFVSEKTKHDAMAGAAVFCHPSVNESLGIVILESWLAGTPCMVHAGSEVLRYQCETSGGGLWFRAYPEFEEELLLILDDKPMRDAMAESGRAYVQSQYCREAVVPRLLDSLDA